MRQRFLSFLEQFSSLRWKLIGLIGLIVVTACSTMGWVFVHDQIQELRRGLLHSGHMLAGNFVAASRYSVLTKDLRRVEQLMEGPFSAQEVVYILIAGQRGEPFIAKSKGALSGSLEGVRHSGNEVFPPPRLVHSAFSNSIDLPRNPPFFVRSFQRRVVGSNRFSTMLGWLSAFSLQEETLYDIVVPIIRRQVDRSLDPSLEFELGEQFSPDNSSPSGEVMGLLHLGVSDAHLRMRVSTLIVRSVSFMMAIIACAWVVTAMLAVRIIRPLHALRDMTIRIREGAVPKPVPQPSTHSEVGELTQVFNQMAHFLQDREHRLDQHVRRLEILSQSGIALNSSAELTELLERILRVLVNHGNFSRVVMGFYDPVEHLLSYGHSLGMSDVLGPYSRVPPLNLKQFPSSVIDAVLIHGNTVLISNSVEMVHQCPASLLPAMNELGISSFVVVPLKTDQKILGLLAGDRAAMACTADDEGLLATVAHQMTVAIEKLRMYEDLQHLTSSLEERVRDRTIELEDANEKLKELDRLKSAFVSITSHELRTPLTAIQVFVDNMLQGVGGAVSSAHARYLHRVQANLDRLRRMIAQLLDLAQIESGQISLVKEPFSLEWVINDVVADLAPLSGTKAVRVETKLPPILPSLQGDKDKMHQVMMNLLHNAIKFTPAGGVIRLTGNLLDTQDVQVMVEDTGCGIPVDEQDKVFRPFFRGRTEGTVTPGAGLGLWVTKRFVELHGGTLEFSSSVGKGTCFTMTLPLSAHDRLITTPSTTLSTP